MSKESTESDRLLELHRAHVTAWNEFDLGSLGKIYDPDCYIFDTIPPPVFKNLGEFLEHVTPALQAFNAFKLSEMEARRGEGVNRRTGRWTEIYEKRDGEWRLIHLHSSDDPEER
jgi:ketosteroid isomerase-like protein